MTEALSHAAGAELGLISHAEVRPLPGNAQLATGAELSTDELSELAHVTAAGHAAATAKPGGSAPRNRSGRPEVASVLPPFVAQSALPRLVRSFVPDIIWILLSISIGVAVGSGIAAMRSSLRVRRQAGQFAAMSAAALTDSLTGVLNRRGFMEAVERELARARRYQRSFVLAYVDVRGLKAVNDSEGHTAGDELLRSVASLLKDCARADDVVGRIGGDELALLLAEQSADGAAVVTRRIRAEVAVHRTAMAFRADWDLTIGTATFPDDGQTFEELLATADRRMYEQRGIQLL